MGSIIFLVILYTIFVVLPFRLAANWLGAERSDWVSCFIAVLIAGALGGGMSGVFGGGLSWAFFGATQGMLSLALVLLISGLTNRIVLGTTFVRGIMISLIGALAIPGAFFVAFMIATKSTS